VAWAPPTADLLDLSNGVRRRADSFRFYLLDQADETIGELHPPRTASLSLTTDTGAAVPRTMSGFRLLASEATEVNPLVDRLAPTMVLQNGEEFQLGVLLWGDDAQPRRPWGTEHASSLVDKMTLLNQPIRATIGFAKGADIGVAALGVALDAGLTLDEIEIDPITADLGVGMTWAIGTQYRTVLGELMNVVGFLPPHFSQLGKLRLVDTPDLSTVIPDLIYEAGGRIIADSILDSNDLLTAPNRFQVYETSGQAQIVGIYDIAATEPHSYANRGFYVTESESAQGLKTTDRANKAAKSLAMRSPAYRYRRFQSTLDPRHDHWDPVTCLGETWMETRHVMELRSGGKHTHELKLVA